jgi:multisubunit Na+/H+ antiporter MnhE subunit
MTTSERWVERLRSWVVWTIALFVAWLALVGTVAWLELVAGGCAAAIAAFAAQVVRERGLLQYRVPAAALRHARRPMVRIVPDFWILIVALVRALVSGHRPSGAYQALPFPAGGSDAQSAGARAFAIAAGSLAPNSVIVDVDREQDLMLVHTLVPGKGPTRPL